jgi:hypothetical protein
MKEKVRKIEIERTARNLEILRSAYIDGYHKAAYNEALGITGCPLFGYRDGELLLKVRKLARTRFCKYSNAVVTYDDGSTVIVKASKAFEAVDAVFSGPRSYEDFWGKLARALES